MNLKNPRDSADIRDDLDVRDVFDSFSDYTRKGARKYGDGRRRIVVPVLIICAVVAALVAANYWMNQGEIYRGVEVGGVALGGKTPE